MTAILKNAIPFRRQFRAIKRALVPYRSNPNNDISLLKNAARMVAALDKVGAKISGATVLEIGSGWVPALPLVFRTAGASQIITIDQERLMDRHTFRHAITIIRQQLEKRVAQVRASTSLFDLSRLPNGQEKTFDDLCRSASIAYLAPYDFMNLQPGVADIIISRTVLEHIPENTLRDIFVQARSVVKPGGLMCHMIDMSDHFEHNNKSLSRLDMLRHDDKAWAAKIRDTQSYQNRLRRFEFARLFKQTGWEIIFMDGAPDPQVLEDLKSMSIIPRYANVPHQELAILTSLVVVRLAR